MLIEHIDAISRQKKRDVLYIDFPSHVDGFVFDGADSVKETQSEGPQFDGENYKPRLDFLKFLDDNNINHKPAGKFARESGFSSWNGLTYIDVPFDENDPNYEKVRQYLENGDGTSKDKNMVLCYIPLEMAMKNAHHDEPGFWEKWAENF